MSVYASDTPIADGPRTDLWPLGWSRAQARAEPPWAPSRRCAAVCGAWAWTTPPWTPSWPTTTAGAPRRAATPVTAAATATADCSSRLRPSCFASGFPPRGRQSTVQCRLTLHIRSASHVHACGATRARRSANCCNFKAHELLWSIVQLLQQQTPPSLRRWLRASWSATTPRRPCSPKKRCAPQCHPGAFLTWWSLTLYQTADSL